MAFNYCEKINSVGALQGIQDRDVAAKTSHQPTRPDVPHFIALNIIASGIWATDGLLKIGLSQN